MVRRPGIALVVSGACCAAASDAEAERARRGTDDETVRWGAVKAAAATTLRAVASMVGTGFQVLLDACPSRRGKSKNRGPRSSPKSLEKESRPPDLAIAFASFMADIG